MPSSTVEDYLKQIYLGQQRVPGKPVAMGWLATAVEVTPGTATAMVKTLSEAGLVHYEPRGGTSLTRKGERLALGVLRRHRLVELFLVQVLGVDWSEVHHDAERLEHAISDELLERIASYLGHPSLDPHGDPIPRADGTIERRNLRQLSGCETGGAYRVERVVDQDARFLRFVQDNGLKPGTAISVERRDDAADAMEIAVGRSRRVTLGLSAAEKILVTPTKA